MLMRGNVSFSERNVPVEIHAICQSHLVVQRHSTWTRETLADGATEKNERAPCRHGCHEKDSDWGITSSWMMYTPSSTGRGSRMLMRTNGRSGLLGWHEANGAMAHVRVVAEA